jgi:hypothetical protein
MSDAKREDGRSLLDKLKPFLSGLPWMKIVERSATSSRTASAAVVRSTFRSERSVWKKGRKRSSVVRVTWRWGASSRSRATLLTQLSARTLPQEGQKRILQDALGGGREARTHSQGKHSERSHRQGRDRA